MNIVLLGCPGSGKDTLADQFKSQFGCTVLTTGGIFRQEAADETKLGLFARDNYWGQGLLCPDYITNRLVKNATDSLSEEQTRFVVFNGYPRSIEQAEFLGTFAHVDITIELVVTEDLAAARLLSRGREDDLEDVIRRRFVGYQAKTEPVTEYYSNLSECRNLIINADATPKDIFQEALKLIEG